jgi:hypothetical protein
MFCLNVNIVKTNANEMCWKCSTRVCSTVSVTRPAGKRSVNGEWEGNVGLVCSLFNDALSVTSDFVASNEVNVELESSWNEVVTV